jgi:thermitase
MARRQIRITGLLLCGVVTVWAGREFRANPGEEVVPNELIVKMRSGFAAASVVSGIVPGAVTLATNVPDVHIVRLPANADSRASSALAAHGLVDYVEPNRVRHATVLPSPSDPQFASQWALQAVQAAQAWNVLPGRYLNSATAGTNRIKVAILDTGIDCTHPDFKNAGASSTDSALGGQLLFSSSQAFIATTKTNPTCTWQDDHGHGTHVGGIVAAATNNAAGVASLGYALQLVGYKVLDSNGNGSDTTIANAIGA